MKVAMRPEAKAAAIFALAGVAVGLLALWPGAIGARYIALAGFIVLYLLMDLAKRVFKQPMKWAASNGIWPYLTTWYATWVVIYAAIHP